MTTLDIHGLGARTSVTVSGARADVVTEALRVAWSRCLDGGSGAGDGPVLAAPIALDTDVETELAPLLQGFTQQVTTEFISAQRGRLFMFHAGAVTDPASGRAIAYVAPGGTGKTTLSKVLGRTHGYVTDETVGFTLDGRIRPYEKPLSVRPTDFVGVKDETSPDTLGLARVHSEARLHRFVLIRRDSAVVSPVVEELGTLDAILELAKESSSLSSLPRPLQTLGAFLEERPPTLRVTYNDAEDIRDLMIEALGA